MLSNEQLYEIMDKLGMIPVETDYCTDAKDNKSMAERFVEDTCNDLCHVMNFVDDIGTWNDLETIKKFLVVLFTQNRGK